MHLCAAEQGLLQLNIRNQPLNSALIELGRQTGISIIFSSADLDDAFSQELDGLMSPFSALDALLAGSHLTSKKINGSVVAIVRKQTTSIVSTPPLIEEQIIVGRRVTGSRLGAADILGSAPVDVISRPQFDVSGAYSLGTFLKFIPAVSGNSTSTAVSNGGNGTATVTLRGLPANNTLVLLNGRRLTPTAIYGNATDLNSIPSAAIERIEILKDGASAIYGSDAVAGVVNVILKDTIDGVQLEQYAGISSRSDLATRSSSILAGHNFDSGSLFMSFESFTQDGLFSDQRDISASADKRDEGGADLRSSATPLSRITLSPGNALILDVNGNPVAYGTSASEFRVATRDDLYNYREETSSISPSKRQIFYVSGMLDLTDQLTLKSDASHSDTKSEITFASTPLFTANELGSISVSDSNIYNPFGIKLDDVRRRIVELGPRIQINKSKTSRVGLTAQLEQDYNRWTLDAVWTETQGKEYKTNALDAERTKRALGASSECQGAEIDGCVPLNLFGPVGSITSDQLDYLRASSKVTGRSSLASIGGSVESRLLRLPSGPLSLVSGFEIRRENFASFVDKNNVSLISLSPAAASKGERDIKEFYSELRVPVASQRLLLNSLDIELALRYSEYSDFGESLTPKLALLYRPVSSLLFRSTFSTGFRAPSLGELHKGAQKSYVFLTDPCAVENAIEKYPGCSVQSDDTQNQYLVTFESEPNLKAEKSKSYTMGIAWTSAHENINATIDYFHIDQREVVDANVDFILDQNARYGTFSDLIERNTNGNIVQIYAPFINIGRREVSGIDTSFKWDMDTTRYGKFTYSFNTSYMRKFINQVTPTSIPIDVSNTFVDAASDGKGALPRWKANTGLLWQKGKFLSNYSINYISSLNEVVPFTNRHRKISPWLSHDLQLGYRASTKGGFSFTLGVENLWDSEPPLITSALNDSYDPRTYELVGRFFYGKIRYEFK